MKKTFLFSALCALAGMQIASAQSNIDISIFPKAKPGMTQHIFNLPKQDHENMHFIEVVAGKMMLTDCNKVMISADLDQEDLSGWGYPYFEIEDVSKPASTMMACPSDSKTEKLVILNLGKDALVRYNSQLPLVVYAPEDLKVGYRFWKTDGRVHD